MRTKTKGLDPNASPVSNMSRKETRRLALLKRRGLFGSDTNGAEITRACRLEELRQAYQLVYDVFLDAGYIRAHPCRMRVRTFEACPQTATFVAKAGDKVVGVQSVVLDSCDLGLPSDVAFRRELDSLRSEGIKLSEAANEAVLPTFRRTAVVTELMRCAAAQAFLENSPIIVTAVSPSHRRFYELLGFYPISGVRSYSSVIDDPVILMALNMVELRRADPTLGVCESFIRDFLSFSNPFVREVKTWRRIARPCFYEANLLRRLFVVESDLLETCTDAERKAIRNRWGDELFAEVARPRTAVPAHLTGRYVPVKGSRVAKKKPLRQAPVSPIDKTRR